MPLSLFIPFPLTGSLLSCISTRISCTCPAREASDAVLKFTSSPRFLSLLSCFLVGLQCVVLSLFHRSTYYLLSIPRIVWHLDTLRGAPIVYIQYDVLLRSSSVSVVSFFHLVSLCMWVLARQMILGPSGPFEVALRPICWIWVNESLTRPPERSRLPDVEPLPIPSLNQPAQNFHLQTPIRIRISLAQGLGDFIPSFISAAYFDRS